MSMGGLHGLLNCIGSLAMTRMHGSVKKLQELYRLTVCPSHMRCKIAPGELISACSILQAAAGKRHEQCLGLSQFALQSYSKATNESSAVSCNAGSCRIPSNGCSIVTTIPLSWQKLR